MNNLFTAQTFTINRLAIEHGDLTNLNIRDDGPAVVTFTDGTTYTVGMRGHASTA